MAARKRKLRSRSFLLASVVAKAAIPKYVTRSSTFFLAFLPARNQLHSPSSPLQFSLFKFRLCLVTSWVCTSRFAVTDSRILHSTATTSAPLLQKSQACSRHYITTDCDHFYYICSKLPTHIDVRVTDTQPCSLQASQYCSPDYCSHKRLTTIFATGKTSLPLSPHKRRWTDNLVHCRYCWLEIRCAVSIFLFLPLKEHLQHGTSLDNWVIKGRRPLTDVWNGGNSPSKRPKLSNVLVESKTDQENIPPHPIFKAIPAISKPLKKVKIVREILTLYDAAHLPSSPRQVEMGALDLMPM